MFSMSVWAVWSVFLRLYSQEDVVFEYESIWPEWRDQFTDEIIGFCWSLAYFMWIDLGRMDKVFGENSFMI